MLCFMNTKIYQTIFSINIPIIKKLTLTNIWFEVINRFWNCACRIYSKASNSKGKTLNKAKIKKTTSPSETLQPPLKTTNIKANRNSIKMIMVLSQSAINQGRFMKQDKICSKDWIMLEAARSIQTSRRNIMSRFHSNNIANSVPHS